MKGKIFLGLAGIFTGFMVWLLVASICGGHEANASTVSAEQHYYHGKMSENCKPSECTPEQKAKCPHGAMEATSDTKAACPATKDCPPAKCAPGSNSDVKTL